MSKRTGIQLALPFEERRILNNGQFRSRWYPPYLVQPKLNGERCRMIVSNGRCLLLSSSEDIIPCCPQINAEGLLLLDGEYDGELYIHGWPWSRIHSAVSREVNLTNPDSQKIQLHLFDLVLENTPQYARIGELSVRISRDLKFIKRVSTIIAKSLEELYTHYDNFISEGYEGFIVRHIDGAYCRSRSPHMMKFKPKQSDEYEIIGLEEAISEDGTPKKMLGAFVCVDDMGTYFKVGAGKLTHFERKDYWDQWLDFPEKFKLQSLLVEYQTMSDKEKVPLFARAVKII